MTAPGRGAGEAAGDVRIHYRRPPDRIDLFTQRLVVQKAGAWITLMEDADVRPMRVGGRTVLEPGSPIVWFTFPRAWHDVGRFHTADGAFTGCYANVLTPVRFLDARTWETTDLFLDVWAGADGNVALLDEDELQAALAAGDLDDDAAERARAEAARLLAAARAGTWPPPVVRAWTLERARQTLADREKHADSGNV